MERYSITDGASIYTRISKRAAIKLFTDNQPFYIIAHKMRPGFPLSMGMTIDSKRYKDDNYSFESMVNNFTFYNCTHETGYYPAFYTVRERVIARKDGK